MAFASLGAAGMALRIEYEWAGTAGAGAPVLVFLHEGLGSVSMWRDFPARLCEAVGMRGLVYSRPGYGRSTPRPADIKWQPDFMHVQARDVLPALLEELGVDQPWLFGHSDGGSIALLYAAAFPDALRGAIVLAPHILVEDISVTSIEKAKQAYSQTDLRQKLARHHDDVDSAFRGWNDVWLSPAFRGWSIEEEIRAIRCPLLAMQGLDDEYGTLEQVRGIARRVPQARLLEIPKCGHSPHKDQPEAVIEAVKTFVSQ
ncbi:MAG TPA: alpha/beta hydrolase [Ramlibacter sp.]|uniref:alpha/beta fold hydrolase n=1 Tax=Ramlibacter sp. TaxID=1917967 RepID=UPI002ED18927